MSGLEPGKFSKRAKEIVASRKLVSGTGVDPTPVADPGVVSAPPPSAPAAAPAPTPPEPQAAPRPAVAPAEPGGGEERIPLSRLNKEIAKAKAEREKREAGETENATLRQQVAEMERKGKIRALQNGEGRPSGFDDLSPADQAVWITNQMLELQQPPAQKPEAASTPTDVEAKFALMEMGWTAQEAKVLHEIQKENPGMSDERLMLIASTENPDLFDAGGEEPDVPVLPASHQVSAARPSRSSREPQAEDPVAKAKAMAAVARTSTTRREAGLAIVRAARATAKAQ